MTVIDTARPAPTASPRRSRAAVPALAIVAALVVVGVAAASLPGRSGSSSGDRSAAEATAPSDTLSRLEKETAASPDDPRAWAALGAAYVDHARANSDPSAYPRAERALQRALTLDPESWEALAAAGALSAGRHDFAPALRFSLQAKDRQPQSAFVLGVIVDSLTELGRYPEAVGAAQEMIDVRPDLGSYARVSYQRELHGDVPGAIDAMHQALQAASAPGDRAFAIYHLGQLEWDTGNIEAAERHFRAALAVDPSAAQARAGLGKVAAARGDLDGAIAEYEAAVAGFADPELLKELGELYLVSGDRVAADARFERSAQANADQAAGGVYVDLEKALFSADHNRDLAQGLAAAESEWSRRQSIHVADAMAWQLFRHGRHTEALVYADRALQLGTGNASFLFHRAEIHRALGDGAAALADYSAALALNPHFSVIFAEQTRQAIATLSR